MQILTGKLKRYFTQCCIMSLSSLPTLLPEVITAKENSFWGLPTWLNRGKIK
uniref:Uncharacterized protein n=1 Tax=Anguilla anguilla TaxID=7936 RepID=A0A0E9QY48_ANGAN